MIWPLIPVVIDALISPLSRLVYITCVPVLVTSAAYFIWYLFGLVLMANSKDPLAKQIISVVFGLPFALIPITKSSLTMLITNF